MNISHPTTISRTLFDPGSTTAPGPAADQYFHRLLQQIDRPSSHEVGGWENPRPESTRSTARQFDDTPPTPRRDSVDAARERGNTNDAAAGGRGDVESRDTDDQSVRANTDQTAERPEAVDQRRSSSDSPGGTETTGVAESSNPPVPTEGASSSEGQVNPGGLKEATGHAGRAGGASTTVSSQQDQAQAGTALQQGQAVSSGAANHAAQGEAADRTSATSAAQSSKASANTQVDPTSASAESAKTAMARGDADQAGPGTKAGSGSTEAKATTTDQAKATVSHGQNAGSANSPSSTSPEAMARLSQQGDPARTGAQAARSPVGSQQHADGSNAGAAAQAGDAPRPSTAQLTGQQSSDSFGDSLNQHRAPGQPAHQANGPGVTALPVEAAFDTATAQTQATPSPTTTVPDMPLDVSAQGSASQPVATPGPSASGQAGTPGSITGSPMTQLDQAHSEQVMARALRGMRGAINQNGGNVTLRLNPPDLGSLRISVQLNHGVVQAQFHASNSAVAQLLDQNMASLRVALEAQGLRVEQLQTQTNPAPATSHNSGSAGQGNTASDGQSRGLMQQDGGSAGSQGDGGGDRSGQRHGRASFEHELLNLVA